MKAIDSESWASPPENIAVKCVILAAGIASRLRPLTDDIPKCLIPVGKKTLLQRTVENVRSAGIREIAVVVGYKVDAVRMFLKNAALPVRLRLIVNRKFESTNNSFSLLLARDFYLDDKIKGRPRKSLLLMDGDVLFSPNLLQQLLAAGESSRFAVRFSGNHDDEEVLAEVDDGNAIRKIGKGIVARGKFGESIGIHLLAPDAAEAMFKILERRIRKEGGRKEFYESTFQEMIDGGTVIQAVDMSELPVIEVDTPEDLAVAENEIAPQIDSR